MKCKKHPKYKGIYPPRVNCKQCWKIYNERKLGNTTNVKILNNA